MVQCRVPSDELTGVDTGVYRYDALINSDIEPPKTAVEGLLVEGQMGFLVGRFSIGKTLLALQLSVALATGRDFLGRRVTRPYKVAFIDTENGRGEIKKRVLKQAADHNLSGAERQLLDENWLYVDCHEDSELQHLRLDKEGFSKLDSFIKRHQIEILIVDNFGQVFPWDEKEEERIKGLYSRLRELCANTACLSRGVILFLHHPTKPPSDSQGVSLLTDPYQYLSRARGSGRLLDLFPIRLALAEENIGEEAVYVLNGFIRSGAVSPLLLQRDDDTLCFELHGDKDLVSSRVFGNAPRRLELFMMLPQGFTFQDAADLKNLQGRSFSRRTVSDTLRVACANGLLQKNSDGSYSRLA
jgi:archaellum biogenesis ATPase FlaH